jgi:hypothetical protein
MRVNRNKPREEVHTTKPKKPVHSKKYDLQAQKIEFQARKELQKVLAKNKTLEKKIKELESVSANNNIIKLNSSEKKIIRAIQNEILISKKTPVIIPRSKFKKLYKVSGSNLDSSLNRLLSERIIKREQVKYNNSQTTWAYSMSQQF